MFHQKGWRASTSAWTWRNIHAPPETMRPSQCLKLVRFGGINSNVRPLPGPPRTGVDYSSTSLALVAGMFGQFSTGKPEVF